MSATINNQSLSLPQNGQILVDDTGRPVHGFWHFLNNLYTRVGGSSANLVPNVPTVVTASTYAVTQFDTTIIFNTSAACVVTLPVPTNSQNKTLPSPILYLMNTSANAITSAASNVTPLGSNTAGTALLSGASKFAMLQFDGTRWRTIMAN